MLDQPAAFDWVEAHAAQLVAITKRSLHAAEVFRDAVALVDAHAYQLDVALMMSVRYWLACPVSGRVPGLKPISSTTTNRERF